MKKNPFDKRGKSLNRNKLRNLPQYKDATEEELDALMEEKERTVGVSKKLEARIEEKLARFSEDYDLSDLKINDREILRGLVQAIIALEDYEQLLFLVRDNGIGTDNILLIDKIQGVMSSLRKDISSFQNDLNITRKIRKSDRDTSVIAFIEDLKTKARTFYASRMSYVFCEKCNTLLATLWTLYPESDKNKLTLTCEHENSDGTLCGHKTTVTSKQLLELRGTNNKKVMPDSML